MILVVIHKKLVTLSEVKKARVKGHPFWEGTWDVTI